MIPTIPSDIADLDATQEWPDQGDWTYADFLRLPDDGRRYEIIRGVLYVANAPSYAHQYTVNEINGELRNFVKKHHLGVVLTAPFEVHLSQNTRPVQPDVLFIPNEKQMSMDDQYFAGVPDLIVEVLSPSSRRYDQSIKLDAYERAGVKEYWIVDPIARFVTLYHLPTGGHEFVLAGEFTASDKISSKLFPKFQIEADMIFLPSS